ncbi:hypothetical protein BJX61DRAFT_335624 [Aspergillus egyptiacus]|nr:hypothetical protein BJX61DRAFT_335624 [Aspergillus egyptiacus]
MLIQQPPTYNLSLVTVPRGSFGEKARNLAESTATISTHGGLRLGHFYDRLLGMSSPDDGGYSAVLWDDWDADWEMRGLHWGRDPGLFSPESAAGMRCEPVKVKVGWHGLGDLVTGVYAGDDVAAGWAADWQGLKVPGSDVVMYIHRDQLGESADQNGMRSYKEWSTRRRLEWVAKSKALFRVHLVTEI